MNPRIVIPAVEDVGPSVNGATSTYCYIEIPNLPYFEIVEIYNSTDDEYGSVDTNSRQEGHVKVTTPSTWLNTDTINVTYSYASNDFLPFPLDGDALKVALKDVVNNMMEAVQVTPVSPNLTAVTTESLLAGVTLSNPGTTEWSSVEDDDWATIQVKYDTAATTGAPYLKLTLKHSDDAGSTYYQETRESEAGGVVTHTPVVRKLLAVASINTATYDYFYFILDVRSSKFISFDYEDVDSDVVGGTLYVDVIKKRL